MASDSLHLQGRSQVLWHLHRWSFSIHLNLFYEASLFVTIHIYQSIARMVPNQFSTAIRFFALRGRVSINRFSSVSFFCGHPYSSWVPSQLLISNAHAQNGVERKHRQILRLLIFGETLYLQMSILSTSNLHLDYRKCLDKILDRLGYDHLRVIGCTCC